MTTNSKPRLGLRSQNHVGQGARELNKLLWPKTMFTPLVMLEWLLGRCGGIIQEFNENPSFVDERDELKIIASAEDEIRLLWAGGNSVLFGQSAASTEHCKMKLTDTYGK